MLLIIVLLEMRRELNCFVKKEYTVTVDQLEKDKKIIFLSDMHNHVYGKDNQ